MTFRAWVRGAVGAWNVLRPAGRSLGRSPTVTAAAVACLALGVGANAAVFAVVDTLLLRFPSGVAEPQRVVRPYFSQALADGGTTGFSVLTSYPAFEYIRDGSQVAEHVAAYASREVAVGRGSEAELVPTDLVSDGYFTTLGVVASAGRTLDGQSGTERGEPVAVVSSTYATRRFGSVGAAPGKELQIGERRYAIIGVVGPRFVGGDPRLTDLWLPLETSGDEFVSLGWRQSSGSQWAKLLLRLRSEARAGAAQREVARLFEEWSHAAGASGSGRTSRVVIASLRPNSGPGRSRDAQVALWLAAATLLVAVVACVNVSNLLLVRALRRRVELATRLALGASRIHLARDLLLENLLLALWSALAALPVAMAASAVLRRFFLADVAHPEGPLGARVLLATGALALMIGLLASVGSLADVSRASLASVLSGSPDGGGRRMPATRRILVGAQAALSVALMAGAVLMTRSLRHLERSSGALQAERVLVGSMNLQELAPPQPVLDAAYDALLARVRAEPGVENAAVALTLPFASSLGMWVEAPDGGRPPPREGDESPYMNAVTPGYFATLGIRLLNGRDFEPSDRRGAPRVAIVGETMARRFWGRGTVIGRCVHLGDRESPCTQVVGVAPDTRRLSVVEPPSMQFYVPLAQNEVRYPSRTLFVRSAGDADALTRVVRRELQLLVRDAPYADVRPLSAVVDPQLLPWRLGATLFSWFAVLAVALASFGIGVVLAYMVVLRQRELGIRMALGADRWRLGRMIIGEALGITLAGGAAGAMIAALGSRYLAPLLAGVSGTDPGVYLPCVVAVIFAGVLASALPARRAARLDPSTALRTLG